MSMVNSSAEDSELRSEADAAAPPLDVVATLVSPADVLRTVDIASNLAPSKRPKSRPAAAPANIAKQAGPKVSTVPVTEAAAPPNERRRRNSTLRSDAELVASIKRQMVEVNKFSAQAGAGSVKALARYRDIGAMVLDEKRLGRFKKPNKSIRDWSNEHLAGVVGGSSAYAMVGLSMSLAKHWEPLSAEFRRREGSGELVGPMGLQAALKLARELARANGDARPKKAKPASLNTRARDAFRALAATYKAAIRANASPAKVASSLTEIVEAARRSIQEGGFAKTVAGELAALPATFEIGDASGKTVKLGKKGRGGGKKG